MPGEIITEFLYNACIGFIAYAKQLAQIDADSKKRIAVIEAAASSKKNELSLEAAQAQSTLEQYAKQNPSLFQDKKSIELPGGSIGYRSTPAKVEIPDDKKEQESLIKKLEKWLPSFVTVKKSIVKTNLANQEERLLKKCGLEVTEGSEVFFVKANAA